MRIRAASTGPLGFRPRWPGTGPALTGKRWPPQCAGRAWKGSPRRFRPVAPIGETRVHSIPDLVARKWDTGALDTVWISDITYLRTDEGWVYLCAVRDACSRRLIGWAMDSVPTGALGERALRMAYTLRGGGPVGVVFQADRGTQYTSTQLNDICTELGIRQSVGRTGLCWDNAMQESFWSTLKTEFYDRRRWPTRHDAIRATGRWIEEFYKRARLHSAGSNPQRQSVKQTFSSPVPSACSLCRPKAPPTVLGDGP